MIKANIAPCGIDCSKCQLYVATLANDTETMLKIGHEWSKGHDFGREITAEDAQCDGCRAPSDRVWLGCRDCAMRVCDSAKDIQHCAHCASFPCDHTKAFEARWGTDHLTKAHAALKQQ